MLTLWPQVRVRTTIKYRYEKLDTIPPRYRKYAGEGANNGSQKLSKEIISNEMTPEASELINQRMCCQ